MKSYTSIVSHMFNNNLPDITLQNDDNDNKNTNQQPLQQSSSTTTTVPFQSSSPPQSSSSSPSTASKDTQLGLKDIAYPDQTHRSFSDLVPILGNKHQDFTIIFSNICKNRIH